MGFMEFYGDIEIDYLEFVEMEGGFVICLGFGRVKLTLWVKWWDGWFELDIIGYDWEGFKKGWIC